MKRFLSLVSIGFILILSLLYFFISVVHNEKKGIAEKLTQAYEFYKKGETAQTIAQRKAAFNSALQIYLQLENQENPHYGNGKLYFNIANTYFQLGEYPLAILYYERALALMPRNSDVKHNLATTQGKLNLPLKGRDSVFHSFFFFHFYPSLSERLQIFFSICLLLIIIASSYVWWHKTWLKKGAILCGFFVLVLLCSLMYTRYMEPLEGILVHATTLYRDAGAQYAKVTNKPFPEGSKVQILDVRENGKWLKIITPNGTLGYVPLDDIRVI
jgi:tetratricopeptide (TPR) repeat protein